MHAEIPEFAPVRGAENGADGSGVGEESEDTHARPAFVRCTRRTGGRGQPEHPTAPVLVGRTPEPVRTQPQGYFAWILMFPAEIACWTPLS